MEDLAKTTGYIVLGGMAAVTAVLTYKAGKLYWMLRPYLQASRGMQNYRMHNVSIERDPARDFSLTSVKYERGPVTFSYIRNSDWSWSVKTKN